MKKATKLEQFFGSLSVSVGMTLVAGSSFATGNLLTPLLPVLTNSLAVNRQQKRIEEAITEIEHILKQNENEIKNLTDAQFQLMSDLSNTIYQSYDHEKIKLLRNSIINTVYENDILEHESVVLSRVLRDISCWEFKFLISLLEYKEITVMDNINEQFTPRPNQKMIVPNSNDDQMLKNLANYNLVKDDITGFGAVLFYSITPIGSKLIARS